jgi:glycogen synthase
MNLAFITYETPFAPGGGIAAVMGRLPGYVKMTAGAPTIVISPFHHTVARMATLKTSCIGEISVLFEKQAMTVSVRQYNDKWPWYFLLPEDKQFFAGERHPYDVGKTQKQISTHLLRDALFFGVMVRQALEVIEPGAHWTLMMQDWEAATTALALANSDAPHRLFLTLHNSYDSGAVGAKQLRSVGINPRNCPGPTGKKKATVLERVLPLIEPPVFTVSRQFALDLIEDTFQAKVMADHLQGMLKPRLVGVDNGPFVDLAVSNDILAEANQGNFIPLRNWKTAKREEALQALDHFTASEARPVWGDIQKFKRDNSTWFTLAGRDDPRQKGYDVAVRAIGKFLDQGGNARFLFFPIPGDEGIAGLGFLRKLAKQFPESVLVLPFLFREGYFAALQGSTYGVMPSLYEPFGMANEFYLNGTVGIGRATGGIIEQIVPLRTLPSFTQAVQKRADRWQDALAPATGILYREADDLASVVDDWRGINATSYKAKGKKTDRVEERQKFVLFEATAEALYGSLVDSIQVYEETPDVYYQMLTDGIAHIQKNFSWERAAQEYLSNLSVTLSRITSHASRS